jgi:hypothetical protein
MLDMSVQMHVHLILKCLATQFSIKISNTIFHHSPFMVPDLFHAYRAGDRGNFNKCFAGDVNVHKELP